VSATVLPPTSPCLKSSSRGTAYATLSRQVKQTGLLERRTGYYSVKIVGTVGAYAAGWVAFGLIGDSWYQMLVAVALGVLFTQVGFLGHDCGHRQVFAGRSANDLLGLLLGDLFLGLSYGWGGDKHNRHHAHPNQEEHDPDISAGALAFTNRQVLARSSRSGRAVARSQAWLFFPMLTLEGLNLHLASVRALAGRETRRHRATEITLFAIHLACYAGLIFLVLSPLKALAFLAIHQAMFGLYMGCSFAPNHKGMPTFEAHEQSDYLERQGLTSRNVRGGRLTDVLLGSLNYQIEHHLFPSMPRPNLRRVQPIVRQYCQRMQLPYAETSLLGSYVLVLRHLHEIGAPLRVAGDAQPRRSGGTDNSLGIEPHISP